MGAWNVKAFEKTAVCLFVYYPVFAPVFFDYKNLWGKVTSLSTLFRALTAFISLHSNSGGAERETKIQKSNVLTKRHLVQIGLEPRRTQVFSLASLFFLIQDAFGTSNSKSKSHWLL
jgi:hypothetical protein